MIYKIKEYANGNFTQISNEIARNKDLSLSARGLLLYMLSCKEDWHFTRQNLIRETNTKRAVLEKSLNELIQAGYVVTQQPRNKDGIFCNSEWIISEQPNLRDDEPFGL